MTIITRYIVGLVAAPPSSLPCVSRSSGIWNRSSQDMHKLSKYGSFKLTYVHLLVGRI